MDFQVITLRESAKWESLLESFPKQVRDIYFSPGYYRTWESVEKGEVLCFYAKAGPVEVLYPFIKREISGYDTDRRYYDISSAYGYGGAISNETDDTKTKIAFAGLVSDWCRQEGVISEFIREYPDAVFRYVGNTRRVQVRTNVSVDTSRHDKDIWKGLPSRTRRDINLARGKGLYIEVDKNMESMGSFYELYCRTASDRGFTSFYFFPEGYFMDVKKYLAGRAFIINVMDDTKEIAASALCFNYGEKMTHHLGASHSGKLHLCPNDLLYMGMITEALERGCKWLNLGGGISTRPEDSLYRFKKKFASHESPVFIETCVHNQDVYKEICRQWELGRPESLKNRDSYFLKYREVA